MKKTLKRFGSFLLAAFMVVAMAIPVMADSEYTITVNGAQTDVTYKAYKVFDATVSGDNVSYTIPTGSTIAAVEGFSGVFATTTAANGTVYVTPQEGVADADIISWLKTNQNSIATGTPTTLTNSNGATSITLDVGAPGYYFITSTVGTKSAVEVTTAKPTATINDKIETSPSIPEDGGKKINGETVTDMQVGTKAHFTITFTATNYATDKDGNATAINSYTVTDTPDGFSIDQESIDVQVNGEAYAIPEKSFSSSINGQGVMTVTIPWDQETYPSPSTVVVSYDATLTDKHIAAASTNKAEVKYDETKIPGDPEVKVYNYKVQITKVDAASKETKLEGAQFVLKNSDGKYYKVANDGAVSWVDVVDNATTVTTDANGSANFSGLASGTYTLVETVAPNGYNLAADQNITLNAITEEVKNVAVLTVGATVEDEAGSTLPSTGGMGTTIFYIVGGILVVGAGVLLITKKRMDAAK